jgi:hypothetical protein
MYRSKQTAAHQDSMTPLFIIPALINTIRPESVEGLVPSGLNKLSPNGTPGKIRAGNKATD